MCMIKISNSKMLVIFTKLLVLLALAKAISLGLWWYLPSEGVELNVKKSYEPKYQRVDFANMITKPNSKQKNADTNGAVAEGANITNMLLKGLYATDSTGYVIVAMKSDPKKTSIVAIAEVYQGYTLKSIHLTNVIFEKEGQDFVLELEKTGKASSMPMMEQSADIESVVSREDIASYAKDPKEIWKDISIIEVKDADKIVGFKVTKINPKSKFASLGLMESDLIIKVNNVVLESYKNALEVYENIDNINTIQIVVIRENQEKELVYEIH